jgi:hypothetical protein
LVLATVLAAAGPVLSACESLDTFEIFDTKKKLSGERKPVFPDGIPGVSSGVPPELVKGYREPEGGVVDPAKAAAEAAAEPAPRPKKPKPVPQRTASKPKPQTDTNATNAAAPVRQPDPQAGTTAPWPASQPQAAWPGR